MALSVYKPSSKLISTLNWNAPEALALAPDGRMAIADRGNQTKIFRRSNNGFMYESTIRVEFVPEDICLLGDRIYLQGIKTAEASVIHEYDFGGMHHGSFGTAYQSDNLLVVNQLSDGPIACDDGADVVVMMFKLLPIVYAYSRDGELAWMTAMVIEKYNGLTKSWPISRANNRLRRRQ